jgi:hypothetical protein
MPRLRRITLHDASLALPQRTSVARGTRVMHLLRMLTSTAFSIVLLLDLIYAQIQLLVDVILVSAHQLIRSWRRPITFKTR